MARAAKEARISSAFRVETGDGFRLKDHDPSDSGSIQKADSDGLLAQGLDRLSELQVKLYAQQEWALLVILQGMDASGKDSVIKHVMSGLNPLGCRAYAFKAPSSEELAHDFLWRHQNKLPERGGIVIFNRSYYEEVLVVRVFPALLMAQHIPARLVSDAIWAQRFKAIRAHERHLSQSGTVVRKFFLNVSKEEQRKRFLERLERPEKNWKFNPDDLRQRDYRDVFLNAYEDMVRNTATTEAPWYVVPGDKKWFARLVVADAIIEGLEEMGVDFPKPDAELKRLMDEARTRLTSAD